MEVDPRELESTVKEKNVTLKQGRQKKALAAAPRSTPAKAKKSVLVPKVLTPPKAKPVKKEKSSRARASNMETTSTKKVNQGLKTKIPKSPRKPLESTKKATPGQKSAPPETKMVAKTTSSSEEGDFGEKIWTKAPPENVNVDEADLKPATNPQDLVESGAAKSSNRLAESEASDMDMAIRVSPHQSSKSSTLPKFSGTTSYPYGKNVIDMNRQLTHSDEPNSPGQFHTTHLTKNTHSNHMSTLSTLPEVPNPRPSGAWLPPMTKAAFRVLLGKISATPAKPPTLPDSAP